MNKDILDLPELLERVQDDRELMLELFDIYLADFKNKRLLLKKAIDQNNGEEIRQIAHALKGSSGNISAKNLHKIFYILEDMGKSQNCQDAVSILSQIDEEFLKQFRGEHLLIAVHILQVLASQVTYILDKWITIFVMPCNDFSNKGNTDSLLD